MTSLSYQSAHVRVWRSRGPARAHQCKCGAPAAHWAYDHEDPEELQDDAGQAFSADPSHYLALCRSCHRHLDLGHRRCRPNQPVGWFIVGTRALPVWTAEQLDEWKDNRPGRGRRPRDVAATKA